MAILRQNKGAKVEKMPAKKTGPEAAKPGSNAGPVKFDSTVVKSDTMAGVTKPMAGHAGSHDSKTRYHGGD